MSEADDLIQTSTISTKTVRMSTIGSRGRQEKLNDEKRFYKEDKEPMNILSSEKNFDRGTPDGEKSSVTREHIVTSCSTSRRLSDHSSIGGDKDVDVESVSSEKSDRRRKQLLNPTSRRSGGMRSKLTADLFHDDFNETMEKMIRDFDQRCSTRFWSNERRGVFFSRGILNDDDDDDEDDFFSSPLLSNRRMFKKSRNFRSVFDRPFEDTWSDRLSAEGEYADSGIFSDGTSSRLGQNTDFVKTDKTLRHDRQNTPEKFEVDIDVQGFKANELIVRTEGRRLIISAKREKGRDLFEDCNQQTRQFQREFDLPDGVNPYDVTSNLLPGGFLRVEAPVKNYPVPPQSFLQRQTSNNSTTTETSLPGNETRKNTES